MGKIARQIFCSSFYGFMFTWITHCVSDVVRYSSLSPPPKIQSNLRAQLCSIAEIYRTHPKVLITA